MHTVAVPTLTPHCTSDPSPEVLALAQAQAVAAPALTSRGLSLQAHALLLRGRPPPPEDTLRALAALRLQSLHRDFSPRAPLPRLDCLLPPPAPPHGDPPRPLPRPSASAALLAGAIWSPGLAKRRAERTRRGGAGRAAGSAAAREGAGGAGTAAAVLGGWKRLRGMGRAEAMAAYLALAAQCPGFGAARYDVLELSTVRGRREMGTLEAQTPLFFHSKRE